MKKIYALLVITSAILFQFCATTKTTSKVAGPAKTTYMADIQPLVLQNCAPCHIPPGRAKALDTFTAASSNIDEILARINKNPGEKGFMPARHPKLSDSTIRVFATWKADGLLEK